jgi:hypothetical protein
MSHRIACYTLFDITRTGVLNRARPGDDITDVTEWYNKRNTQCNFDTILQVVSLRSQPDVMSEPKQIKMHFDKSSNFGSKFIDGKKHSVWTFDFEVQHSSVFEDGIIDFGYLYKDCEDVPMIITNSIELSVNSKLEIDDLNRNIYFVKYG